MKITSSTSITSTSGVVLISAIGWRPPFSLKEPKAMSAPQAALRQQDASCGSCAPVVRKAWRSWAKPSSWARTMRLPRVQRVVGKHGGNGDEQAGGGHDQRLAHRAGHLVEHHLRRAGQPHQRVVDTPDGAEQADEGRGRPHRGEEGQALLDARLGAHDLVAQRAREELAPVDARADAARTVLLQGRLGLGADDGQLGKHAALVDRLERLDALRQRFRRPEGMHRRLVAAAGLPLPAAPAENHHPRGHRQQQQQDGHRMGDEVALGPEMGEAQLRLHDSS